MYRSSRTDSSGNFKLTLNAGTYTLRVQVRSGLYQTAPHSYLKNQEAVRRESERELDALLDSWDREMSIGRGSDVWLQTKIETVLFAPRCLATRDQVRHIKKIHKTAAQKILREEFDTAESRSTFTISMTPAWAEHLLTIQFRDGEAMELKVEG